MPEHTVELLKDGLREAGKGLKGAKIAILGVAFLENSDDTRNTPTKPFYELVKKKGAHPVLHDPYVKDFEYPFTALLDEAIQGSDALVILAKHKEYLNLDLTKVKKKMKKPVLVDGRNAFTKEDCEKAGFIYRGIGKPY